MQHEMKLNRNPFEMIKCGEKIYELRLYDEKRQKLRIGDTIKFTVTDNGQESLIKKVKGLHRFDSFTTLYETLPLDKCGYNCENLQNADPSDMEKYYTKEQQRKYGVLAIELE